MDVDVDIHAYIKFNDVNIDAGTNVHVNVVDSDTNNIDVLFIHYEH